MSQENYDVTDFEIKIIGLDDYEDKKQEVKKKTKTRKSKKSNINKSTRKKIKKSVNKLKLSGNPTQINLNEDSENLSEQKTEKWKKSKTKRSKRVKNEEFSTLTKKRKRKRNKGQKINLEPVITSDGENTDYQQKLENYIIGVNEPKYVVENRYKNNFGDSVMTFEAALKDLYDEKYADQCKGKTLMQVLEKIKKDNDKLKKLIDGLINGKPSDKAFLYRLGNEFGDILIRQRVTGMSVLLNYKTPYDFIMKISEIYPKSEQKGKFVNWFTYFSGTYYLYLFGANKNNEYRPKQCINFGSKTFLLAMLCISGIIEPPKGSWRSKKFEINDGYKNYLPDSIKNTLGKKTAHDLYLTNIVDESSFLYTKEKFIYILNNIIEPFSENISKVSIQTKLGHFNKLYERNTIQNPTYSTLLFLLGRVSAKWLIHTDGWRNKEINALVEMMCIVDGRNRGKTQSSLNKITRDEFLKLYFAPLCVDPIKECERLKDKLKSEKAELENDKEKIKEIDDNIDKLDKVITEIKNKGNDAIINMVNEIIERVKGEFEKVEPKPKKKRKNRSKSENKNYSKTGDNGERSEASKSVSVKNKKTTKLKKFEKNSINTTQKKNKKNTKQTNEDSKGFVNQNMIIESEIGKNEIDSKNKHNSIQGSQLTVNGEKENNQNLMPELNLNKKEIYKNTALQNIGNNTEMKENNDKKEEEIKHDMQKNNSGDFRQSSSVNVVSYPDESINLSAISGLRFFEGNMNSNDEIGNLRNDLSFFSDRISWNQKTPEYSPINNYNSHFSNFTNDQNGFGDHFCFQDIIKNLDNKYK